MHQCSFSSKFAGNLIDFSVANGADRDALWECLGLETPYRNRDDIRIPSPTMARLWAEAHNQTNDPHLAFHMGVDFSYSARTTPSLIMQTSSTVLDAFEQAIFYGEIIANVLATELGESEENIFIDYTPKEEWRAAPKSVVQDSLAIAIVSNLFSLQSCLGRFIAPSILSFEYSQPSNYREYLEVFNSSANFDQSHNQIGFPKMVSSLPTANSDNGLLGSLKTYGNELRAKLSYEDPTVMRTREIIIDALSHHSAPTIEKTASLLHITVRTLQRRLHSAGFNFQRILDDVRKELADRYLRDGNCSQFEVAYLLGYSNSTAFLRAYKRWHGTTPAARSG